MAVGLQARRIVVLTFLLSLAGCAELRERHDEREASAALDRVRVSPNPVDPFFAELRYGYGHMARRAASDGRYRSAIVLAERSLLAAACQRREPLSPDALDPTGLGGIPENALPELLDARRTLMARLADRSRELGGTAAAMLWSYDCWVAAEADRAILDSDTASGLCRINFRDPRPWRPGGDLNTVSERGFTAVVETLAGPAITAQVIPPSAAPGFECQTDGDFMNWSFGKPGYTPGGENATTTIPPNEKAAPPIARTPDKP